MGDKRWLNVKVKHYGKLGVRCNSLQVASGWKNSSTLSSATHILVSLEEIEHPQRRGERQIFANRNHALIRM